jgi:LysR family glycine cleavage system transcriptional activator
MSRSPLNPLQTFVAAARAQNMTRAAERLHLTVSALSHQIRLLEERVDCSLFVPRDSGCWTRWRRTWKRSRMR